MLHFHWLKSFWRKLWYIYIYIYTSTVYLQTKRQTYLSESKLNPWYSMIHLPLFPRLDIGSLQANSQKSDYSSWSTFTLMCCIAVHWIALFIAAMWTFVASMLGASRKNKFQVLLSKPGPHKNKRAQNVMSWNDWCEMRMCLICVPYFCFVQGAMVKPNNVWPVRWCTWCANSIRFCLILSMPILIRWHAI